MGNEIHFQEVLPHIETQVMNSENACRFPKCVRSVRVETAHSVQLEARSHARRGRHVYSLAHMGDSLEDNGVNDV